MATATKAINLRVDANLKAQAESIFAELGLPTSTAITMFLKSVVRCGGLPLDLHVRDHLNAETIQAMDDVNHDRNLSRVYESVDELMEALDVKTENA